MSFRQRICKCPERGHYVHLGERIPRGGCGKAESTIAKGAETGDGSREQRAGPESVEQKVRVGERGWEEFGGGRDL